MLATPSQTKKQTNRPTSQQGARESPETYPFLSLAGSNIYTLCGK
ncbi:unnamed protein product [Chondrus crispus]|uniref:Uncharacterized protein n=1 Tax=Chondrus crispus TaxID=2769 RepID=R7QJW2_CHOCR|nr:unnamed protein product [Chondrus crispus]CDF37766.1 unnamed protein product [Chondrus crispus]|eukprot:XP_005717637.1 unnamed protein product [Chondrus crispus]